VYHPSKAELLPLRELTNYRTVGAAMSRVDQTSISFPFMTGGYLGWNAKDVDVPGATVTEQRASGFWASVWGRINGIA